MEASRDTTSSTLRHSVGQVTRLAVGAVGGIIDQGANALGVAGGRDEQADGGVSRGDVVVGAVVSAQESAIDAAERLVHRVSPLARWAGNLPVVRPMSEAVSRRVNDLGERGASERAGGKDLLGSTVDNVVSLVLQSERLGRTVDEVVGEVLPGILESALPSVMDQLAADPQLLVPMIESLLGPILDSALPTVIDKLNEDPEVVRNLVLGQSTSIAGDVAGAVRSRGVTADDVIERLARKVTLRKPRPELPGPPRQLGSGEPAAAAPTSGT